MHPPVAGAVLPAVPLLSVVCGWVATLANSSAWLAGGTAVSGLLQGGDPLYALTRAGAPTACDLSLKKLVQLEVGRQGVVGVLVQEEVHTVLNIGAG